MTVATEGRRADAGTYRNLDENDQAELLYDPISLRWRVTPCCGVSS